MRLTWLLILANVWAGISPAVTLLRKPGLFLSLRLTNSIRIFALYAAVVPLQSLHTVSSTVRARCMIRSDAAHYVSGGYGEASTKVTRTKTGFKCKGIIEHFDTLVACFVAGD